MLATALAGAATAAAPAPAVGAWVWPLAGAHAVSRAFDPPETPYGRGHRGADLPGDVGVPVRAAGAGRISYAGLLAGRGVVVVVHGELRTTYEPVTAAVRVGQQVSAGQLIGHLDAGHAGCRPACLHWGLLRGAVYLDPVRLVSRGPSVLLPVGAAAQPPGVARVPAAVTRAAPAPSATPGVLTGPRPAEEPAFALRSGEAASAGGALAALVAGLMLLRSPPRPPQHPATPAAGSPGSAEPASLGLIDLTSERHRRRSDVA